MSHREFWQEVQNERPIKVRVLSIQSVKPSRNEYQENIDTDLSAAGVMFHNGEKLGKFISIQRIGDASEIGNNYKIKYIPSSYEDEDGEIILDGDEEITFRKIGRGGSRRRRRKCKSRKSRRLRRHSRRHSRR